MSLYEMLCFAKVYCAAFGFSSLAISRQEIDIAFEVLKKATDNRQDWTQEQKDVYKLLVDFSKNQIEGN